MSVSPSLPRVVLVPLKRFDAAKSRLRDAFSDDEVVELTIRLAAAVLDAARPLPTVVVCDDEDVADFARRHAAVVFRSRAPGLNGSVHDAYRDLGQYEQVIVVHGDLRDPEGLGRFDPGPGVTIVTDHRRDGTNVLALPGGLNFRFGYGPGSLNRHVQEAERLGLSCTVITNSPWRFDVDEPGDLLSGPDGI
jgi:2-phospho-L-lactate guanylyltransferase